MKHITYSKRGDVGVLTINRPQVLNALNQEVLQELKQCLTEVACKKKVSAVILTGTGDKAFIAGADIKEMAKMNHLQMMEFCELGHQVTDLLENGPFLSVAAVNGYALGGGLEMALACDFIYCSEGAKLGLPEVTLGIIPGFGGTQRLSRAVGTRRAKELVMSGMMITAQEAVEIGIANKVCNGKHLMKECREIASTISNHSTTAILQAKNAINSGYSLSMKDALEMEKNMCSVCFATEERKKGMDAFVNKKKRKKKS